MEHAIKIMSFFLFARKEIIWEEISLLAPTRVNVLMMILESTWKNGFLTKGFYGSDMRLIRGNALATNMRTIYNSCPGGQES